MKGTLMARAFGFATGTTDVAVVSSGTLVGYSITESAGAPAAATVQVRNGPMVYSATEGGAGLTSFTLTADGQTTASIDDEATAAQVKAALELLNNVADGDITCTRTGAVGTYAYHITFGGTWMGRYLAVTSTPTGGTGTVTMATVSDPMVAYIELAANGSSTVQLPAIDCPSGIYLDRTAGETMGVVYLLA